MDDATMRLFNAAERGDLDAVDGAMAAGADVNAIDYEDETGWGSYDPVEVAAAKGHHLVVRSLLQHGAKNRAFIDTAIRAQHLEVVREWLRIGERPSNDFDSDGVSVLMHAAGGSVQIVKLLVESGADPNAVSSEGKSALSVAVGRGNRPVIEYLVPLCSPAVRRQAGLK